MDKQPGEKKEHIRQEAKKTSDLSKNVLAAVATGVIAAVKELVAPLAQAVRNHRPELTKKEPRINLFGNMDFIFAKIKGRLEAGEPIAPPLTDDPLFDVKNFFQSLGVDVEMIATVPLSKEEGLRISKALNRLFKGLKDLEAGMELNVQGLIDSLNASLLALMIASARFITVPFLHLKIEEHEETILGNQREYDCHLNTLRQGANKIVNEKNERIRQLEPLDRFKFSVTTSSGLGLVITILTTFAALTLPTAVSRMEYIFAFWAFSILCVLSATLFYWLVPSIQYFWVIIFMPIIYAIIMIPLGLATFFISGAAGLTAFAAILVYAIAPPIIGIIGTTIYAVAKSGHVAAKEKDEGKAKISFCERVSFPVFITAILAWHLPILLCPWFVLSFFPARGNSINDLSDDLATAVYYNPLPDDPLVRNNPEFRGCYVLSFRLGKDEDTKRLYYYVRMGEDKAGTSLGSLKFAAVSDGSSYGRDEYYSPTVARLNKQAADQPRPRMIFLPICREQRQNPLVLKVISPTYDFPIKVALQDRLAERGDQNKKNQAEQELRVCRSNNLIIAGDRTDGYKDIRNLLDAIYNNRLKDFLAQNQPNTTPPDRTQILSEAMISAPAQKIDFSMQTASHCATAIGNYFNLVGSGPPD